jgi:UDP-N-acetylmuramyl pentapeptide synthase
MALTMLHNTAAAVHWLRAGGARALCTDSRRIHAGDAFLAWRGVRDDGRRHVADALTAGAVCCLVDSEGVDAFAFDDRRVACTAKLKAAAGAIADAWYGHPSRTLDVVAVTGTNGKT